MYSILYFDNSSRAQRRVREVSIHLSHPAKPNAGYVKCSPRPPGSQAQRRVCEVNFTSVTRRSRVPGGIRDRFTYPALETSGWRR